MTKRSGRLATAAPLVLSSSPAPGVAVASEPEPRVDVVEIARALQATLAFASPAGQNGLMARAERALASDVRQAWAARRGAPASVYVSLSEKVGLPLALLGTPRGRPHVLLAHHLTSARKRALHRRTGYLHRFARVVVLCRTQERYLLDEAGLPAEKVRFVYDKVDHRFFAPLPNSESEAAGNNAGGYVLSVGRERRDYETLMASARTLPDVRFVIVASSPWSRQSGNSQTDQELPTNVSLQRGLSFVALRDLYARADLVVVPLQPGTDYAAGVNGVLEAMAMQKPLIVSDTPGIRDYVSPSEAAARAVPAGDDAALARAIREMRSDPAAAQTLGGNARRIVEAGRNLDGYVAAVANAVREVVPA